MLFYFMYHFFIRCVPRTSFSKIFTFCSKIILFFPFFITRFFRKIMNINNKPKNYKILMSKKMVHRVSTDLCCSLVAIIFEMNVRFSWMLSLDLIFIFNSPFKMNNLLKHKHCWLTAIPKKITRHSFKKLINLCINV